MGSCFSLKVNNKLEKRETANLGLKWEISGHEVEKHRALFEDGVNTARPYCARKFTSLVMHRSFV